MDLNRCNHIIASWQACNSMMGQKFMGELVTVLHLWPATHGTGCGGEQLSHTSSPPAGCVELSQGDPVASSPFQQGRVAVTHTCLQQETGQLALLTIKPKLSGLCPFTRELGSLLQEWPACSNLTLWSCLPLQWYSMLHVTPWLPYCDNCGIVCSLFITWIPPWVAECLGSFWMLLR